MLREYFEAYADQLYTYLSPEIMVDTLAGRSVVLIRWVRVTIERDLGPMWVG